MLYLPRRGTRDRQRRVGLACHVALSRHRAAAAFLASLERSSDDTLSQRAFAPFLPPLRPQARINSSAASVTEGPFVRFGIVTPTVPHATGVLIVRQGCRIIEAPALDR